MQRGYDGDAAQETGSQPARQSHGEGIRAELGCDSSLIGIRGSGEALARLALEKDDFHGELNHVPLPQRQKFAKLFLRPAYKPVRCARGVKKIPLGLSDGSSLTCSKVSVS